MKKMILILGIMLLIGVDLYAAPGGGLGQVKTSVTTLKETLEAIAKIVAAIGLIFLAFRYFMTPSEQRSIPWGWIVGAIVLGSIRDILALFNIS